MKKRSYFNTILNDIDKYSKILKESYVFDDKDDYDEYDDTESYDDEEQPLSQVNNISEKISQIRTLALDGIQEYAKDVDSKEYDFFKKIWLMCDKVTSEKENAKNSEI